MKQSLMITFALLYSSFVFGSSSLFFVKGKVLVNEKIATPKQLLKIGDIVEAKDDSLAIIKLEGQSTIKLSENSQIKIDQIKAGTQKVDLEKGSVFVDVVRKKLRSNQETFQLKARQVAMGVRGTRFFAAFGKGAQPDIWMCVDKGIVSVKGKDDTKEKIVNEGEGVVVKAGTKSSSPKPLPWTKHLNFNMNPEEGEVENHTSIEAAYEDPLGKDYD